MSRTRSVRALAGAAVVAAGIGTFGVAPQALATAAGTTASAAAQPVAAALIRVDQVGYLPSDAKHAYLMTTRPVAHATWAVVDGKGQTAASGNIGTTNRGPWNANYPDVYDITFSGLTALGTYHLVTHGGASAQSPAFSIESAAQLYGQVVAAGVNFYQVQRDGADVIAGPLNRQPAHLNDAHATVYETPDFNDTTSDDSLVPGSPLVKVKGAPTVDAEGGWYDAGDYLKFTHTAAFGDVVLYASERALGNAAPSTLKTEAAYGESWLDQMWQMSTKTLYLQVGVGTGNGSDTVDPTFNGDHDLWRLPQADATDTDPLDRYATVDRPVFEAAAPGHLISPNLAGRVSAAFALAAQVDAATNKSRAEYEYLEATSLYAMANTSNPPSPLVTADPEAYYPETTWHDDMELGATEIALAAQALSHDATPYLKAAAGFAKAYIADDASAGDTFNLYDTSALAHTDLVHAMAAAGNPKLAVSKADLIKDLKRQVELGASHASSDVFRAAGDINQFDVDSHTFGWIAMEAWYTGLTGDHSFDAFAAEQRDWLFGANAWGTSFMVGEGSTFPDCMQHQVANLSGNLHGAGPALDVGAVVNGPNDNSNFEGGLGDLQDGMRQCPTSGVDKFAPFDTSTASFVDDVRSWQTDEPALDMTGAAIIAAASQLALH
ncbi:MAG TPA: glycoside hydrolase family 9 protein [Acidothermaceae bacterium]|nr:glycoside hydrolase family 9 protein [Acidothermaceae bacterium]